MIDLEAHVLPGLDDGAADEATAVEMCEIAADFGTAELVAAPSCDAKAGFDRDAVDAKAASLQERIGDRLHLHTGAVLELGYDSLPAAITDLSRYSINRRRYLLVQPTAAALARGPGQLMKAIREAGYTAIVSQPEVRVQSRADMGRLRRWVKRGCLLAVNSGSLFGHYGSRAGEAAFSLLDAKLAHFVVSAGRSAGRRAPALLEAYRLVEYRWGETKARQIFIDNPWHVLWGEPLAVDAPGRPRRPFSVRRALGLTGTI